ncbi:MAG: hypothetical protein DYG89_41220 [Caldilinea sp. CFX5]|nr:hypothetical protein [Caldilinea sp. CFX5]
MNTYPEFSIEPFTFAGEAAGEYAGEYDGEFTGQEWEDEASRRGRLHRRVARPRVVARRWWRPRPWLVRTPGGSEYVRWLQSALNQIMDLSLPVDGVMDSAVRSALRSFQQQQGLPVDGIVGPDTERALLAARAGQPATKSRKQTAAPDPTETEVAEQAWESWEDEVPPSNTQGGLMPVSGIENTSQAFKQKVIEMAQRLGTDPNFLMAIMSFESNGFNPQAKNPHSGATGLIQFMPKTAEKLGTTTDALARMTAEQQLDYVAKYFAPYTGRLKTLEDAYMAVLWPPAIGQGNNYVLFSSPSREYQQNQLLDLNKDGKITVTEAAAMVRKKLGSTAPTSYVPGSGASPQGTPDIVSVRGIQVARQIASQVEALLAAAEADGVKLSGGGYRSTERQIALRKQNCGSSHYDIYEKPSSQCSPPTAPPGRSQHEKGLAIDFTYNGQGIKTRNNPGFQWLASNAARFGLKNLPSEPWHWSVDGR